MSQCRNVDFETKIASRNVAIVVSEKDCEFVAMSQRYYSGRCRPMVYLVNFTSTVFCIKERQ